MPLFSVEAPLLFSHSNWSDIVIELTDLRQKESSFVSGNRPSENFLSLTRPHSRICIRIYNFNFKKQTKKQKKKIKRRKEEKRIYPKNRLKNKFAATPVMIFLVMCISGNKSIFFFWSESLSYQIKLVALMRGVTVLSMCQIFKYFLILLLHYFEKCITCFIDFVFCFFVVFVFAFVWSSAHYRLH